MKKAKIIICLLVSFNLITGNMAFAQELTYSFETQYDVSYEASQAPAVLIQLFEENNIDISDDAVIEIKEAKDTTGKNTNGYALCAFNRNGTKVKYDVLLPVAVDSQQQAELNRRIVDSIISPKASDGTDVPPWDDIDGVWIKGTGVVDYFTTSTSFSTYVDPWGSYFTYEKTKDNVNVSYASVSLESKGRAYSYPEFTDLGYVKEHEVVAEQSNPVSGEMYYKISHLPSDIVINPMEGAGTMMYGLNLGFDVVANGQRHGMNVSLNGWQIGGP